MVKPTYEFKKLGNGRVAFITKANDEAKTVTTIETTVDRAKEHYKQMISSKKELLSNLSKLNHELKVNEVKENDEMAKFIDMADNAAKYKKYQELVKTRKVMMEQLETADQTIKDVENSLPEVKRMKE